MILISNCIYKIENCLNGHIYIGVTNDFERRMNEHINTSFNENSKDFNSPIHRALRKYGVENFTCEIIEDNIDNRELMKDREQFWIKHYNSYENREHYNATPGGDCCGENSVLKGEAHGRSLLIEDEVRDCRQRYHLGERSRDVYNKYFTEKITYDGFSRMWHGKTWQHIMPEVFQKNPHRAKYTKEDRDYIVSLYKESQKSLKAFSASEECYVGYGTLWKMVNTPEFYDK